LNSFIRCSLDTDMPPPQFVDVKNARL